MSHRPTVEAVYPGYCTECEEHYPVGTLITPGPGGWIHETCPAPEEPATPCPRCWLVPSKNGVCGCEN